MGASKTGFILGLIGGIFGILAGILFVAGGLWMARLAPFKVPGIFSGTYTGIGIWWIISAVLVIVFSSWMKVPEKCKIGGILTLIFSVIGGGTILGMIGGIFGIVEGSKTEQYKYKGANVSNLPYPPYPRFK